MAGLSSWGIVSGLTRTDSGRMARRALMLAVVVACFGSGTASAAGTRIHTVAGGGATVPSPSGSPATASALVKPTSVRAGYGGFLISDASCRPLQVYPDPGSDTGPIGFGVGSSVSAGLACAVAASPPAFGGGGAGAMSPSFTFAHPCCFDDWAGGPLTGDSDAGRVEVLGSSGRIFRVVGKDPPAAACATAAPPALPADGTDATLAQFCKIIALDAKADASNFIVAEQRQDDSSGLPKGDLWSIEGNAVLPDPIGFTVHHVSGAWSIAEARIGPYGGSYIADGYALVVRLPGNDAIAGDYDTIFHIETPGFSGDGGVATAARLDGPRGLTFDYGGRLVVADTNNCRIRALDTNDLGAHIHTIAGRNCQGTPPADIGDGGLASDAYLGHPAGIEMTPGGLLIADQDDNRIRLIDRTSIVTGPSGPISIATPQFTFGSLDFSPRFKCKLDGNDIGACDSPFTLASTGDGEHTLAVWDDGHDAESSEVYWSAPPDPTPATRTFTIDTTAPAPFALQQPEAGANQSGTSPTFTWTAATDATSGVDHYELWIDKAKDRDVPNSSCLGDLCSAQAVAPLTEGERLWQVRAIDGTGNVRSSEERALTIGAPPVASFTISPNPALAGRTVTFDASGSSDPSGISRFEWDLDGDGTFETDGGGAPVATRSYPAPASVKITLRVTDGTGKQSTSEQSLKVTSPAGAQSLLGVSINNGAQYTRDPDVTLTVKAPATASAFLVSNDGGFFAPATFPAAGTVEWKLDSSGPERLPKTVYLRFILGPIISDNYTDDIILDEVPPVIQSASLATPTSAKAAAAAAVKAYSVKVKAKDSNSGVGKVQVTANKRKPGKLIAYRTKLSVKLASKPKFVRAQDRAGNFSAWKKLR